MMSRPIPAWVFADLPDDHDLTPTNAVANATTTVQPAVTAQPDVARMLDFILQPARVSLDPQSVLATIGAGGGNAASNFMAPPAIVQNVASSRAIGTSTNPGPTVPPLSASAAATVTPKAAAVPSYAPVRAFNQFSTGADVPTDTYFSLQWNLRNTGQTGGTAGVDINILPVWRLGYTGKGVHIGVYDTAMDVKHVDLAKNIDLSLEITKVPDGKFVDPTKVTSIDDHATSVGGIIAAARDGQGVVGVAYDAKITPVDILGVQSGNYGWEAVWQANKFDITNNSWGFTSAFAVSPTDASAQYWVLSGMDTAAVQGRHGLGTLENLAAGNYRQYGLTTELTGVTVDRHMNVIGAVDYNGMVSYYSNPGASLLVVAPSNSVGAGSGITTDDVTGALGYSTGNYTSSFGGTSAATPEISGIEADMLQANPNLGWRDVQDILALTARHVGSAIGSAPAGYEVDKWVFNGAHNWNGGGLHFSNDYGFGLVDAFAAVEVAKTWNTVMSTPQTSANELAASATLTGSWNIGAAKTNTLSFTFSQHMSVEAMTLDFPTLNFAKANDLTVTLMAPDGTTSKLLYNNGGAGASIAGGWELMSREFLNEDVNGTWKVTITDNNAKDAETLNSAKLTAYGGSQTNNSVFFYTDEFAQMTGRGTLSYTSGNASIDAAATTGGMTLDLTMRLGTLDGKSLQIATNTNVTKVITGDGASQVTGNDLGDTIVGGLSNDILKGGKGNDVLDGGAGTNTLTLGAGADKAVLHPGGFDNILDFTPGQDKLMLTASEFGANLAAHGITAATFATGSATTTRVTGGGLVFDPTALTLYADTGVAASPLQAIAHLNVRVTGNDFLMC